MKASIVIRMYGSTYKRIRKYFKAQRGETMISYFERLSKSLEAGWDKILKIDPHGNVGVGK